MLIRIVKMEFHENQVNTFLRIFRDRKINIRAAEGCKHLAMWQSTTDPSIIFTYSHWEDADALELYRNSDLFKSPPRAWSLSEIT